MPSCSTRLYKRFDESPTIKDTRSCVSATSAEFLTIGGIGSAIDCTRAFHIFLLHFLVPADLTLENLDGIKLELYIAEVRDEVRKSNYLQLFQILPSRAITT